MSAPRQAVGILAAVTLLSIAREASAGTATSAQWYVETVGTACEDQRAAFEREITLACNAVGGTCRVAAAPTDAELRAVIDCSSPEESWTLVTRSIDGTILGTLDLIGPPGDRLREAAVEVARDAAPEQVLATDALRFTLTKDAPSAPASQPERLTLVVGGRIGSDASSTSMGGLHVLAGLALAKSVRGTLGAIGEGGGNGASAIRAVRGGPGLAFGAPFEASAPVGFAVEGGVAATNKYGAPTGDGARLTASTVAAGYCQGTVTAQWPRAGWRPYAALSAAAFSDGLHIVTSGELGLAVALF